MSERIRSAFGNVVADDELKEKTRSFLISEIERRKRRHPLKLSAAFAAIAITFSIGLRAWFAPTSFIGIDINPSAELAVNAFGVTLSANGFNEDGERLLGELRVKNKNFSESLRLLLEKASQYGYLNDGALVSVTVLSRNPDSLGEVNEALDLILKGKPVVTDVFEISQETRTKALEHHITPAKYLAIEELQQVDPDLDFDACASHSISEIRELIEEGSCDLEGHEDEGHEGHEEQAEPQAPAGMHESHHSGHHGGMMGGMGHH
ncbi:MAG: hypothetical protein LBC41_15125 [Clostridiales bacterium]|jgi:hypothetical protein|nr:hypothetical protein [Clostridiales bacterium]